MKIFVSPMYVVSQAMFDEIYKAQTSGEEYLVVITDDNNPFLSSQIRAVNLSGTMSVKEINHIGVSVVEELPNTEFIDGVIGAVRVHHPEEPLELYVELTDKKVSLKPSGDVGKVKVVKKFKTYVDRDLKKDFDAIDKETASTFKVRFGEFYTNLVKAKGERVHEFKSESRVIPYFVLEDTTYIGLETNYATSKLDGLSADDFADMYNHLSKSEIKVDASSVTPLITNTYFDESPIAQFNSYISIPNGHAYYDFVEIEGSEELTKEMIYYSPTSDIGFHELESIKTWSPLTSWIVNHIEENIVFKEAEGMH